MLNKICIRANLPPDQFRTFMERTSKRWVFQLEQGLNGTQHCQGYCESTYAPKDLKSALEELGINCFVDYSRSPDDAKRYAWKDDTRVLGPWSNFDLIPKIYQDVKLRPWQQELLDHPYNNGQIIYLYDPNGRMGKTFLAHYLDLTGQACYIPYLEDYKDIMRAAMCKQEATFYIIDIQRVRKPQAGFWQAIESLSDGYMFDDRYKWQERHVDPPRVVVLANTEPAWKNLSTSRWLSYELVPGLGGNAEMASLLPLVNPLEG